MDRVKALMSKENRSHTLITVGAEEAATCFDAPTSQDVESYDSDISGVDGEDAEVVPDEEDDTQIELEDQLGTTHSKMMKAKKRPTRRMVTKLKKPDDKKPVQKCGTQSSSGSRDGPVSFNRDILAKG